MEIRNNFSWSQSRHRTFSECRRKYFYNHYGFWGGWTFDSDRRTREIYVLKKLQNLPMFVGDSVHKVIEGYLNDIRKGREVPLIDLIKQFRGFLRHGFDESRQGLYKKNPKKYCALFEHEYKLPLTPEDMENWQIHGEKCIKNFYESDLLKELKASDVNGWLPIEQFQDFDLDGTTVYVKIDFARKDRDKTIIYDWKTGKSGNGKDPMQLACYAYYANKRWDSKLPITTINYNLYSGEISKNEVDEEDIAKVESEIKESIKKMKDCLFNPTSNSAREKDFPKKEGKRCDYCNFKRVCLEQPSLEGF